MNLADIFNTNTGGIIENPNNAITESQIAAARAQQEVMSDPLTKGLDLLGGLLMNFGANSISGKTIGGMNNIKDINAVGGLLESGRSMVSAFGGTVAGKNKVNAEGGEVIETPDGQVSRLQGASHEQGGIDLQLPDMTNIFSQRLKIKGKTLAQRKMEREMELDKLKKKLKKNPKDQILQNTINRLEKANKILDEKDLNLQEEFKSKLFGAALDKSKRPELMQEGAQVAGFGLKDLGLTAGDLTGIVGQLYGMFSPMNNTLANRASDTPNENFMEDYGRQSLAQLDSAKDNIQKSKDIALQELELSKTGASIKGRNTATNVNTLRNSDLAAFMAANKASDSINKSAMAQESTIDEKKANTLLDVDLRRRLGAEKADIANREDKDNFYTELGKDKANIATGAQHLAKSFNQIKSRKSTGSLLSAMSDFYDYNPLTDEFKMKDNIDWDKFKIKSMNGMLKDKLLEIQELYPNLDVFNLSPKEQLNLLLTLAKKGKN